MQNLDMNKKKIIFDIDGTLLETKGIEGGYELINQNDRILDWMNGVNKWYDEYEFEAFTARGSKSGFDFKDITYKLMGKGVNSNVIDDYICKNHETMIEYEVRSVRNVYLKKKDKTI